jgi:hypothetical protein
VIIDSKGLRDSKWWLGICIVIFIVATVTYARAAHSSSRPLSGGSKLGLTFAIPATAMIAFAMLLSLRRRLRTWRLGNAYSWMQGHIWMSLLSYPLILYHAAFHWGGTLTSVLMWLFTIVVVSGIVGLVIQQFIPTALMHRVPTETVRSQIDHILNENLKSADRLVQLRPEQAAPQPQRQAVTKLSNPMEQLQVFYQRDVRPWLAGMRVATAGDGGLDHWAPPPDSAAFASFRAKMSPDMQDALNTIEAFVDERKRLLLQKRYHRLLHAWLLVHVPLAWAMVVLIPLHAVMALRY